MESRRLAKLQCVGCVSMPKVDFSRSGKSRENAFVEGSNVAFKAEVLGLP